MPDFPREYELQYLGEVRNVFSPQSIEDCQEIKYDPERVVPGAKISIGVDPGMKFAIVATRWVKEQVQVIVAEDYDRPFYNAMIDRIFDIQRQHGEISAIYCDAANPEFWMELKKQYNERYSKDYVFERLAHYEETNSDPNIEMKIIPLAFSKMGKEMLQHAKSIVEENPNVMLIDKRFDKLLIALRTCKANEYLMDKRATSYNDILDAFRLSLQYYVRGR